MTSLTSLTPEAAERYVELASGVYETRCLAEETRPDVLPDNGDDPLVCAIAALCLEVHALGLILESA
jgi:hypothetical protein